MNNSYKFAKSEKYTPRKDEESQDLKPIISPHALKPSPYFV